MDTVPYEDKDKQRNVDKYASVLFDKVKVQIITFQLLFTTQCHSNRSFKISPFTNITKTRKNWK